MKPILLLLGSLVLLVLVFLSGVIITANVIAEPEPHKFAHMDTPDLWTSQPKAVDTASQNYQRLPTATPPASVAAETQTTPAVQQTAAGAAVDHTMTASIDPQQPGSVPQPQEQRKAMVEPRHADWCYTRYKSYRIEDNSYQPLSGGPGGSARLQSPQSRRFPPHRCLTSRKRRRCRMNCSLFRSGTPLPPANGPAMRREAMHSRRRSTPARPPVRMRPGRMRNGVLPVTGPTRPTTIATSPSQVARVASASRLSADRAHQAARSTRVFAIIICTPLQPLTVWVMRRSPARLQSV